MSSELIGLLGILALVAMLLLRIPVAFAIFTVGFVGVSILASTQSALNILVSETYTVASNAELIVIPLFILMGNIATHTGMSRKLYDAAYSAIGSIRGGLASATILGCAGFSALSGSSVASALTMGRVSIGEMERYRYSSKLATGAVAAGGTLGILIPPSTGFVLYAILTQQSIGRLFLAGVVPGLLLCLLFIMMITLVATLKPELAPAGPKTSLREKVTGLTGALPIMVVILITIGGIYTGIFSPVEAAAVGAGLVILFGVLTRSLTLDTLWKASKSSVITTATVLLILIAAHMLNPFLAMSQIPMAVGGFLNGLDVGPYTILFLILACYLVLGCFLEGYAMLVLTLPIFFPVIMSLGIDPILFGVLVVLTLEIGLISPPVGINVFIVKSVAQHVPLSDIFRGVIPFWIVMILTIGLLVAFPDLVLFLPRTMIT